MKTLYDLVDLIYESQRHNTPINGHLDSVFNERMTYSKIMLIVIDELLSNGEFRYDGRMNIGIDNTKTAYMETYTINHEPTYKEIVNEIKSLLTLSLDDNIYKGKAPLLRSAYALSREIRLAKRRIYTELVEDV